MADAGRAAVGKLGLNAQHVVLRLIKNSLLYRHGKRSRGLSGVCVCSEKIASGALERPGMPEIGPPKIAESRTTMRTTYTVGA